MPAAIVVPISGPYIGVWNALPLGTLSDDGYEISCGLAGQEVNETDAFGMTLTEAIFRGQNWRCRLRGLEWKSGLTAILQAFGTLGVLGDGNLTPLMVNIGDRWSKFNQTLLLTAILGSPPTVPRTLTANSAGFAPNTQSLFIMTSKVRELPLELVLLPYTITIGSITAIVPFTTT